MHPINVYTTMPPAARRTSEQFHRLVAVESRLAEELGWHGTLIYSDNRLLDPFVAAAAVLSSTTKFVPIVAVNPLYSHPFATARAVASLSYMYDRRIDINYVTGGFRRHLNELGCRLDHDERYAQLEEHARVVNSLLGSRGLVTHAGTYYRLEKATVTPPVPRERVPQAFVAGNSPAAIETARSLGATRLTYPHHIGAYLGKARPLAGCGIRLGLIVRDSTEAAWAVARQRFSADPAGEKLHEIAVENVESHWHIGLSAEAFRSEGEGVYWLYPFRAYKTLCPYLVGSYHDVATALSSYLAAGVETIILDELVDEQDAREVAAVIRLACDRTVAAPS